MTLSTVIVGLGQIGLGYDLELDPQRFVYTHARAFGRHPSFRLVAGVDPDERRCAVFTSAYGVPAHSSLAAVTIEAAPELVVIATATQFHTDVFAEVLKRWRPRAILCEKPLSYDLTEARRMVEACRAQGIELFVNYMRRSDPGAIEIKRRLVASEMNGPVKGTAWYTKGFLHNGSHLFNLLEYWLGPVSGWTCVNSRRIQNGSDAEVDVLVAFAGGMVTFLAAREEAFSIHTMELLMSNGRLRYENGGERIEWCAVAKHPRIEGYTVLSERAEIITAGMDRYQWNVAAQLAEALKGRPHHLCSGSEALKTLETMQAILEVRR